MPTAVQNKEKGPSVFSDPVNNVAIEWAGIGDPNGGDIQYVPDSLMQDINFIRAINRGIFEKVEMSADVQARMDQQGAAYRERRDEAENNLESVMDRTSEQTIVIGSVDEKGQVQVATQERDPDNIPVNVPLQPDVYGPEEQENAPLPAGSVVQMDEQGQVLQEEPELKVSMGPREREG
jgi:hypothetical protein